NPKILSGPVLTNSPNAVLSKTLLGRYNDLALPVDRILATYVWIDGTGEHLRCKDRTLTFIPKQPKAGALAAKDCTGLPGMTFILNPDH
ncbi:jg19875, partial [Pararge aegeria aegeria]